MYRFIFLLSFVFSLNVFSFDAYLLPARPGKKSEIVPVNIKKKIPTKIIAKLFTNEKATVDQWLSYGGGDVYYLGSTEDIDTFLVWFNPPAPCSLLKAKFDYTYTDRNMNQVKLFFAEMDINTDVGYYMDSFPVYHFNPTGNFSSPILNILVSEPESVVPNPDLPGYVDEDTFDISYLGYDDSLKIFGVGWVKAIPDFSPNPMIYANGSPPYHTLMHIHMGYDSAWYMSKHELIIAALVRFYGNPLPVLRTCEDLPDNYSTDLRTVNVWWEDWGVPLDSGGVKTAITFYQINNGPIDSIIVDKNAIVYGDSTNGVFAFTLPGVSVGDTVTYWVSAIDLQGGRTDDSTTYSYVIRSGTPGNFLLLVDYNSVSYGWARFDYYWYYNYGYFGGPVWKNYSNVLDFWDTEQYGNADSSVLDFYASATSDSQKTIVWMGWGSPELGAGWGALSSVDPQFVYQETSIVKKLLDNGGNLWLADQDQGYALGVTPNYGQQPVPAGHWARTHLGIAGMYDDYNTADSFSIIGDPTDPYFGNLFNLNPYHKLVIAPFYWAFGPGDNWTGVYDSLVTGVVPLAFLPSGENVAYYFYNSSNDSRIVNCYFSWDDIAPYDTAGDTFMLNGIDEAAADSFTIDAIRFLICNEGIGNNNPHPIQTPRLLTKNLIVSSYKPLGISFTIPTKGDVNLDIYDYIGRYIHSIVNGRLSGGVHRYYWKIDNIPNGVYILKMRYNSRDVGTGKVIVVR